ncbi:MAG: alkaline phosphatase family protein [Chloroflexi bacterium]|nr:alkaline phosphatase family protein [Chloroflexota bacterium]MYD47599.1 alkaline phosphatase family protein [Chloroflexota bacterium]
MPDAHNVLIVVFDGLQPSQITPELMPNLAKFADGGVTFANHHPVFPTVTRVNASSMVTGCLPGRHGLAGNTFLCRDFDPHRIIPAMEPTLQAIADATGKTLLAPTLADILGRHGREYIAIGNGTSGNAYQHNPNAAMVGGATIHPDFTLPRSLHSELETRFGAWPPQELPNTSRLAHARRIMTEYILPELNPAVALLWSSEPDKTQHEDGVGTGRANQALSEADAEFGNVMAWLEQNGRLDTTDVFIASDHGYSTISRVIPVEAMLRDSGFPTIDQNGGVAVAANGGSALFYVNNCDPGVAARFTRWLTAQDWCGPLFASERVGQPAGTLPASIIGCDGLRSPDLIMSFPWNSDANEAGYAGHAPATGGVPGQGQHGSMSRHELRNVGLARGPSLRSKTVIDTPTGNVDLAPTILRLLGITGYEGAMEGRAISEALKDETGSTRDVRTEAHEAETAGYRQKVQVSQFGGARYVDWGNRV